MALVVADMPRFSVEDGHDLDAFIHLYIGYLNAIGVNPNGVGGPPTGRERAMGILRSCLQGSAAQWFDETIVGKNWKLSHFITNGGANMAVLRGLAVAPGAVGLHANSFVAGSPADIYSRDPANIAVTIGASLIPNHDILGGDREWERIGAEPSGDAVNGTAVGNNNPIVLQGIRAHQAISYMRRRLPSIIKERREMELHRLVQGSESVRTFWNKVERAGKLLKLPEEMVTDHFYRGLSGVCSEDLDRIDPDLPVKKVVDILEKIEKRRFQLHKSNIPSNYSNVNPMQAPPVMSQQEPSEMRKVAPQAVAQEQIDRLINAHTDKIAKGFQDQIQAFQNQIQDLQKLIPKPPTRPPLPTKQTENMQRYYEGVIPNPFDDEYDRQYSMDEIMGTNNRVTKIANRVARKIAQAEERRQDRELVRAMQGLGLGGHEDGPAEPMDVDLVRIGDIEVNADDLNVYIANLIRSKKK